MTFAALRQAHLACRARRLTHRRRLAWLAAHREGAVA